MSEPRINAPIRSDAQLITAVPQRVLFLGQLTSAGTATSGELITDIQNDGSESTLFGANSMLAEMVRQFKLYNQVTQLDCIPVSDGSGAAATATATFVGTATDDGSYTFYIGSRTFYSFTLSVETDDTVSDMATALAALINANTNCPVTAEAALGVVTLTAVNLGTTGNNIGFQVIGTVPGDTVTITAMTGGDGTPTLTNIFDVVGEQREQTVVCPFEYGLDVLTGFLDPRFNVNNKLLDGVGITSHTDTYANLVTSGAAQNSQNLVILGNRVISQTAYKGSALFELDYGVSAQFAALRSLRLTTGADISAFVVSTLPADTTGGVNLSSLPYANTPFKFLPLIDLGLEFILTEEQGLNDAGVSILSNNDSNNLIVANRIVTTYKTNGVGSPDNTFKFLNLVDTSSAIRQEYFNFSKQQYAQTRLTNGDTVPNSSMVSTKTIEADYTGLYSTLSGADFSLTTAGESSLQFYKDNLNVQIDNLAEGSVTASMIVQPVSQLRDMFIPITISFNQSGT